MNQDDFEKVLLLEQHLNLSAGMIKLLTVGPLNCELVVSEPIDMDEIAVIQNAAADLLVHDAPAEPHICSDRQTRNGGGKKDKRQW